MNAKTKTEAALNHIVSHVGEEEASESSMPSNGKIQEAKKESPKENRKYDPTVDDFFDYIGSKVTQDEWSTGATCLYLYKEASTGNVRLERLYRPITFEEMRDSLAPKYGPGNYLLQFNTRLKHLSSCSKRLTFDGANMGILGEGVGASAGAQSYTGTAQAIGEAMKIVAEGTKVANTAMAEMFKQGQIEGNKPVDIAGIVGAISNLLPKPDNSLVVSMLAESEKRAERELRAMQERLDRDVKAAQERSERDQRFFQLMMEQQKERAADQQKFFELLLKEKDKKEDTYGMVDVLKDLFRAFAQERLEGGNDTLPGWAGVAQTFLPKLADALPLIVAQAKGQPLTPQMIQATQAAQAAMQGNQGPVNGQSGPQVPASIPMLSTEQQLGDLINRLGLYLTTHDRPDAGYFVEVITEEYGAIADLIYRNPKEVIFQAIQQSPLGARMLSIPTAPLFVEALIDAIKNPEGETEPLGDTIQVQPGSPTEETPVAPNQKKKKAPIS